MKQQPLTHPSTSTLTTASHNFCLGSKDNNETGQNDQESETQMNTGDKIKRVEPKQKSVTNNNDSSGLFFEFICLISKSSI